MDNKLSELSKPVAWPNDCNETAVEGLRYLAEKPRPSYGNSPFNTEHLYMIASEIKRMADQPLYSQEYVSALLAELEAKDKRIDELERANQSQDDHINQQQDRIDSLEKTNAGLGRGLAAAEKWLATPVRLPSKNNDEFWFDGVFQVAKFDRAVERAISAAGFKFVGDE